MKSNNNLHFYLLDTETWYAKWDKNPHHNKVHWAFLMIVSFFLTYSLLFYIHVHAYNLYSDPSSEVISPDTVILDPDSDSQTGGSTNTTNNLFPFGSFNPNTYSCTILVNQSNCSATLTWTTTNVVNISTVTNNGTATPGSVTVNNNTTESYAFIVPYRTISSGVTTFFLSNNGTTLATALVTTVCVSGTTWNGSICAPSTFTLTYTKSGTGVGTVTSFPFGINCSTSCSANFNSGVLVTLTATAGTGSSFIGWSGDCSGTGSCVLTMNSAKNVTATFDYYTVPPSPDKLLLIGGSKYGMDNCQFSYYGSFCNLTDDVWSSMDGKNWTRSTSSGPWAYRQAFGAVYFNDKYWAMGGFDKTAYKNDVWSSSDGITWTQVTANAGWNPRASFASVVFDNKIWILGGNDKSSAYGDVWSSSDGITWTQVTANAGWDPIQGKGRWRHSAVVFCLKFCQMYVMGGTSGFHSGGDIDTNDVWSSSDGKTWTQVTANAGWRPRCVFSSFVFNRKIWIIGGEYIQSKIDGLGDIWSSSDGKIWTQVAYSEPFIDRHEHTSLIFNNKMWLIGGMSQKSSKNDVWSSVDGLNWIKEVTQAPWLPRASHKVITNQPF